MKYKLEQRLNTQNMGWCRVIAIYQILANVPGVTLDRFAYSLQAENNPECIQLTEESEISEFV